MKRKDQGAFHNLMHELQFSAGLFKDYTRFTPVQFQQLLDIVQEDLVHMNLTRESICPKQRLALCLR